ncbi:MAG: hypothetical protein A3K19_16615 [Lentisphaerae bacterium RIFOXYB12_FULL_65_16]|nr:MAG: hypothetical protein A3K18_20375 [Lentisphaerae bacterium RIFOXYA12_64_32]OGV89065.1 MAG: hypothetical protein A3K19_16615 [Lentisphaerae bacterium RIFOXYB12_FULL_65_16]
MSLWHRIKHPCVWFTEQDVPRLKRNAETEFWKPKFEQWRTELSGKERRSGLRHTVAFSCVAPMFDQFGRVGLCRGA